MIIPLPLSALMPNPEGPGVGGGSPEFRGLNPRAAGVATGVTSVLSPLWGVPVSALNAGLQTRGGFKERLRGAGNVGVAAAGGALGGGALGGLLGLGAGELTSRLFDTDREDSRLVGAGIGALLGQAAGATTGSVLMSKRLRDVPNAGIF